MGSVRLTERFVRHDPPSADELAAMRAFVRDRLEEANRAVPLADATALVAVAGTPTTVQAIALDLPFYDPERLHRTRLAVDALDRVLDRLTAMTNAERAAIPVMAPGRGDVIVAGIVTLQETVRRFGFEEVIVSETDILDGLAFDVLASL
jgi:exopolyphosphatase/guanosine-5'-triphosphate,3'-diphosphate pyrophosphatase